MDLELTVGRPDQFGTPPLGDYAILRGSGPGTTYMPGTPCPGFVDLGAPLSLLGRVSNGTTTWSGTVPVPPILCGEYLQAINLTNCERSNIISMGVPNYEVTWEVGSTATVSSYPYDYRGNVFRPIAEDTLVAFEVLVGNGPTCEYDFYVHRSATGAAPWTLVAYDNGWHGSNAWIGSTDLNVQLDPAYHYAVGIGFDCSMELYRGTEGQGSYQGIGEFRGTAWDHNFFGHTQGYGPPNSSLSSTEAYHHRYIMAH